MVNENTLRLLNRIGFGADIDSLESYLLNYAIAHKLTDMEKYEANHEILVNILKDIKPTSKVIGYEPDFEEPVKSNYTKMFEKLGNQYPDVIYGSEDTVTINRIKNMAFDDNGTSYNLVALIDREGIDLICIYVKGILYKVYTVSETTIIFDVTNKIRKNMPQYIEELRDKPYVEMRAKAYISEKEYNNSNICCDTVGYIRTCTNLEKIKIEFNDMFYENIGLTFKSQWEKLNEMKRYGFEVPEYCMLRNIDKEAFFNSLIGFDEYFYDNSRELYQGNPIKIKKDIDTQSYNFIAKYTTMSVPNHKQFEATVVSMATRGTIYLLKIVPVKCNDKLTVESIEIRDIYMLEKNSIGIGSKVTFEIVEDTALLI